MFGALRIELAGLTVELTPPTPTPTPTCDKNDHAGKPSAAKAQNLQHCANKGKEDATDARDKAEKDDAATAQRADD